LSFFQEFNIVETRGTDPEKIKWLDGDFLYRINYGPASAQDVLAVREAISEYQPLWKRGRLTLLDRRIAVELVDALFNVRSPSFSSDPDAKMDSIVGQHIEGTNQGFGRRLSPFEYNPFTAESEPLRTVEDLCVNCVWSKGYSSTTLGSQESDSETRPAMAAVVTDMIAMMKFFSNIVNKPAAEIQLPLSLEECFILFVEEVELCSVERQKGNPDLPTEGYLWDLFTVIVCITRYSRERQGWKPQRKQSTISDPHIPTYLLPNPAENPAKFQYFPGGAVLGIERSPVVGGPSRIQTNEISSLQSAGSLEELDANYIHSGPYRLKITKDIGAHLTLNNEGYIMLYFNPVLSYQKILHARPAVPGDDFSSYKTHNLGKL
jgi:hypothetical protein